MASSDNKTKYYWKLTKSLYGQSKSQTIPTLTADGIDSNDDVDKARVLNEYFISQTRNSSTDSSQLSYDVMTETNEPILSDVEVVPENILQCLNKLKIGKACGPDGICNNILKFCADSLTQPITYISEKSIKSGQFPSSWKKANIRWRFLKIKMTNPKCPATAQCLCSRRCLKLSKDKFLMYYTNFACPVKYFPKITPDLKRTMEQYIS